MPDQLLEIAGRRVLLFAEEGPPLAHARDVNDFISALWETKADWAAIPTTRLTPDFWRLSTRLAGEVIQKFVNYRAGLAIIGDISAEIAASGSLRDFVRESNSGSAVWFVQDIRDLDARLRGVNSP
ncbi:MAG: DUF4180 domain-containing protein [Caulobacteraceae bacterium]|nr:DUF4180 domain-containing protein [Caulobacteraceae bacterium]